MFSCAQRFPKSYSLLLLPFGLLGYVYLLSFPVIATIGIGKLLYTLVNTPLSSTVQHLGNIMTWCFVVFVSLITTRKILFLKFSLPEGISLNDTIASSLHKLLEETNNHVAVPRIDRIIITEQLSLDIAKTPRYPLPLWSTNTLVVGLPLMQCLSPEYFKCALVRKMIQHSKSRHPLQKWLAQLRTIWPQYAKQVSVKRGYSNLFLHMFFKFYVPFYRTISIPVANYVELLADQDTLDVINDEDLLQTIEKIIVSKIYLEKQYWPKIKSMVSYNRFRLIEPYSKLEQVLRSGLTPQLSKRWLDTLYCNQSTLISPVPDLRSRMHNIGRSKVRIPEKTEESAARYFLDNAYSDIVAEINQLWLLRSNHLYDNLKLGTKPFSIYPHSSHMTASSRMNSGLFN